MTGNNGETRATELDATETTLFCVGLSRWRWSCVCLWMIALLCSCSEAIAGPEPSSGTDPEGDSAAALLDPGIVCRDQLSTEVAITGDGFSPVPIDIPGDPKTALPTITLTRTHELDGSGVSGPAPVTYSGDADADPTNAFASDGTTPWLKWQSQQSMSFVVTQELTLGNGEGGMLTEGIYDVGIANPNGESAESLASLAVVDKPVLSSATPGIVCLAQEDRTLALSGTTFLRIAGEQATLQIEGQDNAVPLELEECSAVDVEGLDAERCENATATLAQRSVGDGYPLLTIQNPETAACHSEEPIHLRVVPEPSVERVVPALACVAENDRAFVIEGSGFLRIDGEAPAIRIGDVDVSADDMEGCESLETTGHDVQTCTSVTMTIAADALPTGLHPVALTNPEPAGCSDTAQGALRIVPEPQIDGAIPSLACFADNSRVFSIEGSGFLRVDGEAPAIRIGDLDVSADDMEGCESLETAGHEVQTCAAITVTVAADALASGLHAIKVTNPAPAGCSNTAEGALRIVPPPSVQSVQPELLCLEQSDRQITVFGSDFLTVDGEPPAVQVGDVELEPSEVTAEDCTELEVDGLNVEQCNELQFTIPQAALDAGAHDVTVANPDPAGCLDTGEALLAVVDGPEVASVAPALVCTDDGSRQLAISGTGFLTVDTDLPIVTVGGESATVDDVNDCTSVQVEGLTVQSCETLSVTVAQGALSEGRPAVSVQNPSPAGCSAAADQVLTVPPATSIASVAPSNVCASAGDTEITISGTGFLQLDGTHPALEIDDAAVVVDDLSDCTELEVVGMTAHACTTITATVSPSALSVGDIPIALTSPDPSGCAASVSDMFRVVTAPSVTEVSPANICSDVQTTITITGTNFASGAVVSVGDVEADAVDVISETQIEATFSGGVSTGEQDVTVENGVGCADTAEAAIAVDPTPIVFFVDPPVIYNDVSIEATIFTSGLAALAESVELVDDSGTATALTFASPTRVNRIQATVPGEETLAPGDYEVRVTSDTGCAGGLSGAVSVTDSLAMGDLGIEPSFASQDKPTAVTITVDTDSGDGFESIPRAYLNPTTPGSTATALRAVVMVDANTLTAVIPDQLDAGNYDLIVVNPSGAVGFLPAGVTVNEDEPPVITSVMPASFVRSEDDEHITIRGEHFDDVGGVEVQLLCNGMDEPIEGFNENVIDTETAEVDFDTDVTDLHEGDICLVELTNADGSSFLYSAISVRNNEENLNDWNETTDMQEARRALSLIAARPTATSRYLYAIGGDSGVDGDASAIGEVKSSVEFANVDVYGELKEWSLQRNSLPEARTWAGAAIIGRFIYLVGGHNGTSATSTLYRAEVLNPLAGPEIMDLDAQLGDGDSGLEGGRWFYRVAATYPSSDNNNPGGESVAGEVLNVQLPSNPNRIEIKLEWDQVAGANGYRVYRSPLVDGSVDDLALLAEITCGPDTVCDCSADPTKCEYWDVGDATTDLSPLPPGSLGVWHAVSGAALNTAREAHATVVAPNLDTAAVDDWFIYAFGGRDDEGTYLDTYEVATVTVNGDGSQTVSAWIEIDGSGSPTLLSSPRAELGAWALGAEDGEFIGANEVWIYIGPGRTSAAALSRRIDANLVGAAGDLGTLTLLENADLPPQHSGCGYGSANNKLFLFGGQLGVASNSAFGAELCDGVECSDLPNLMSGAWNAAGVGNISQARIYMGSTQESAFFFLAGGHDGTSTLNNTEQTVQ